jgi:DeoR/GlpR family transcriptional regulator of sugar metabolism
MFTNSILIKISGFSQRTFYRYLSELRKKGTVKKEHKYYFDEKKALVIAEKMGFTNKFEKYLKEQDGK